MLPPLILPLIFLPALVRCEVMAVVPLFDSADATEGRPFSASRTSTNEGGSASSLASVELLDTENVVWAGRADHLGNAIVATMKLNTHDTEKIISMQRFSKLLTNVTCSAKSTTLTFMTLDDFLAAVKAWSWVNDHDSHFMHVLANWKGCLSPLGNLQPYHFDKMTSDATQKTITLEGGPQEWSQAAHSFIFEFGRAAPDVAETDTEPNSNTTLSKRSLAVDESTPSGNSDITDLEASKNGGVNFEDSKSGRSKTIPPYVSGFYKSQSSYNLDITSNVSGVIKFPGPKKYGTRLSAEAKCTNCQVAGKIKFDFRAEMKGGQLTEVGMNMTASGVRAQVGWSLKVLADTAKSLKVSQFDFTRGVPGMSFSIPHIFRIGMSVQGGVGLRIDKFYGELGVTGDVAARVNEGAQGNLDLLYLKAKSTNFGVQTDAQKIKFVGGGKGSIITHAVLGVGLGASLFTHESNAELLLNIPGFGFNIDIEKRGHGYCGSQIKVKSGVAIILRPFVDLYIHFQLSGTEAAASNVNNPVGGTPKLRKRSPIEITGRSNKGSNMLNTDPAVYDEKRRKQAAALDRPAVGMPGSDWKRHGSNSKEAASDSFVAMGQASKSGSGEWNRLDSSSGSFSESVHLAGDRRNFWTEPKDWTLYQHKYPIFRTMCIIYNFSNSPVKAQALHQALMGTNEDRLRVVRRSKGLVAPVKERVSDSTPVSSSSLAFKNATAS